MKMINTRVTEFFVGFLQSVFDFMKKLRKFDIAHQTKKHYDSILTELDNRGKNG